MLKHISHYPKSSVPLPVPKRQRREQANNSGYQVCSPIHTSSLLKETNSPVTKLAMGIGRPILREGKLEALCEKYNDYHLGAVPESIGKTQERGFQLLNSIVPELKKRNPDTEQILIDFGLNLKKIGRGSFGRVYLLIAPNGEQYALKVYNGGSKESHGPFSEMAIGLYCASNGVEKDISKWLCGNPKAGYSLYECLEGDANINSRQGITLREAGLHSGDVPNNREEEDKNLIGDGVICDHGGISELKRGNPFVGKSLISHPSALWYRSYPFMPSHQKTSEYYLSELNYELDGYPQDNKKIQHYYEKAWNILINESPNKVDILINLLRVNDTQLLIKIITEIIKPNNESLNTYEMHVLDTAISMMAQNWDEGKERQEFLTQLKQAIHKDVWDNLERTKFFE